MRRIIIVDDEATVIRILRRALEQAGYQVETARNGLEALEAIARQDPDVLVTDIEMPRMTGQELCQALHQQRPDRQFPIFVVTSLTAIEHRDWSEQIPNLYFLEKPVSIRRLTARLKEYFEQPVEATQHG
jgi:chemosensory pili system protein ChpA (sensor histidine kinase/response regulator)